MKYSVSPVTVIEVQFVAQGSGDPIGFVHEGSVSRVSAGVYDIALTGSGPLRLVGQSVQCVDPDYQGAVTSQTADRTFRVTLQSRSATSGSMTDTKAVDASDAATYAVTLETTKKAVRITAVEFLPDDVLTADNTDFATLTVAIDDDPDVTVAEVTTEITGSGDWTADVAVPLVLTADALSVAAGSVLLFSISKDGTGVTVPAGTLTVSYEDAGAILGHESFRVRRAADALAADETLETVEVVDKNCRITSVQFVPDAALTAHGTNFATLSLVTVEGSPETIATVTTEITGSGNWVAGTPVTLAIDTDADDRLASDVLALEVLKDGAGVAVPAGILIVKYTVAEDMPGDPVDTTVCVRLVFSGQNI